MDWQVIREQARRWYGKTAEFLFFLWLCSYLLCCVVAGKPVGPKAYVGWTYHCIQWTPGRAARNLAWLERPER